MQLASIDTSRVISASFHQVAKLLAAVSTVNCFVRSEFIFHKTWKNFSEICKNLYDRSGNKNKPIYKFENVRSKYMEILWIEGIMVF